MVLVARVRLTRAQAEAKQFEFETSSSSRPSPSFERALSRAPSHSCAAAACSRLCVCLPACGVARVAVHLRTRTRTRRPLSDSERSTAGGWHVSLSRQGRPLVERHWSDRRRRSTSNPTSAPSALFTLVPYRPFRALSVRLRPADSHEARDSGSSAVLPCTTLAPARIRLRRDALYSNKHSSSPQLCLVRCVWQRRGSARVPTQRTAQHVTATQTRLDLRPAVPKFSARLSRRQNSNLVVDVVVVYYGHCDSTDEARRT